LEQSIRSFGRKAFRRPLIDAEVTRFQKLGQTSPAGTPDEVAETTLLTVLVSPSSLLVPELTATPAAKAMGLQLSSYEVASRLSFLLWGSVPDDMLNAAADANKLQTQAEILAQAQRMISMRERTWPLVASFHREWAYDAVERYIDGFYNPTRRHSLLGYVSPLSYERQEGPVAA
jgi:transposase InsO family protein